MIIKSRPIWHPRAWQLLREKAAAEYARQAVPQLVAGVRILFPEPDVSLGRHIEVKARRIPGQNMLPMLYDRQTQDIAIGMALVALEALYRAKITPHRFALFAAAYRYFRKYKVIVREALGPAILSKGQKRTLDRLLANRPKAPKRVLVHGDLHASNLIVNLDDRSLGFVDLEMMHIGNPVTDFAQLWIGFYLADPQLGQRLYKRYAVSFPEPSETQFDAAVRAEIAIRCYSMVHIGWKTGNTVMQKEANALLVKVLNTNSFASIGLGR